MTTVLEKHIADEDRKKQDQLKQWRFEKAKEFFPDLKKTPYVERPFSCNLPWWVGLGHKEHFFHGDEFGIMTSLWVCLRCGLVSFRLGGGEFEVWNIKQGYTNPNNYCGLAPSTKVENDG